MDDNAPTSEQPPPGPPAEPGPGSPGPGSYPPPPPHAAGWGSPGGWTSDPYWNPQPPRHGSLSVAITAVLVLVAVLAGVGIGRSLPSSNNNPQPSAGGSGNSGANPFGNSGGLPNPFGNSGNSGVPGNSGAGGGRPAGPADVSAIARKVDPSLVDINTNLTYENEAAAGTGIILSAGGLVLTNNHVIDQATSIRVTVLATGRQYPGKVVGYDESSDVAVVKVEGASGLHPAALDRSPVRVGQDVVAVGNAGGKGGTPTPAGGTITALHQAITASDAGNGTTEKLSNLIETDAAVQPGDSGGSLVDTDGQVVGMDTAASQSFSFSTNGSQGFAIPIGAALHLARLIDAGHGSSSVHVGPTAFIGVKVAPKTCSATSAGPSIRPGSGALVCGVVSGTAASRAGLATDDVITSLSGRAVSTPSDLTKLLVPYHPGQTATIGFRTVGGARRSTSVTFGSGPPG
jgi:S1-C subfamily serine protease